MSNTDTAAAAPTHKTISIGDKAAKLDFDIPLRYGEGHTVNAAEANVLNQIMRENIGNNWRDKVKATIAGEKDALSESELRAKIDEYVSGYQFNMAGAGAGRETLTPLERECRKLAKAAVIYMLAQPSDAYPKGRKQKDVPAEVFDGEVARIAATDKVITIATKNLKTAEKQMNDLISDAAIAA